MKRHHDALVISGGGVKGVAAAGAVRQLQREGLLDRVKLAVGTSAGAIVAAAFAANIPMDDLYKRATTVQFSPAFDFTQLSARFGLDSGESLGELLASLGFGDETLGAVFRRTGIRLAVCVTDVDDRSARYFSSDTDPDLRIVDALRMTCSVPLIFATPPKYKDKIFIDGCLADNFPLHWATNHSKNPLGIALVSSPSEPATNLQSFIVAMIDCATSNAVPPPEATVLTVSTKFRAMQFDLPKTELKKLYKSGANQARDFVKKKL